MVQSAVVPPASGSQIDVRCDLSAAVRLDELATIDELSIRTAQGERNLWVVLSLSGTDVVALCLGPNLGELLHVARGAAADGSTAYEFTTPIGPMRARISLDKTGTLRCTSSLIPTEDTVISYWPRDLFALDNERGSVHTHQRGLRGGIVFASHDAPDPYSLFYFQNFSALTEYFKETKRTPADTVGGVWPELGYAPPAGFSCTLPKAREFVVSDAYLTLTAEVPHSTEARAGLYLDLLAQTYALLERRPVSYHDWPARAASALRDLSLSPDCTDVYQGRRYLLPYVGDKAKPPESMVQFTVAINASEYDRWRKAKSDLATCLREGISSFFNADLGTVVRWLPGEPFDSSQAEENMNHDAMDSWYVHHALFNLFRFAKEGDERAKAMFRDSLPYAMRVAHRFDYRWPVFFSLTTLDIIRAESAEGKGGETDVAGLYADVMLHAYEMFGDESYLQEARAAMATLSGLGFQLAYQLNTTGFAAEAALRLWKITHDPQYLGLSEICMANLFDNMWLWECGYGRALHYHTFFGLFPLRDAPYIAPYEELEAHAKFNDYLAFGGEDVRPSLQLLIAEFQKYSTERSWFYYPDALPLDSVATQPHNGRIERNLSVPLEDLRDGMEASGQVGQEIYGAGLAFVIASRHYVSLPDGAAMAYSNYPMLEFTSNGDGSATWRAGGDPRCSGELRVFIPDVAQPARAVFVTARAGTVAVPLVGHLSPEGHAVFELRGGQTVDLRCVDPALVADESPLVIGSLSARG